MDKAYVEDLDGNKILDLKDHPLHVISYSLPIDKIVSRFEERKWLALGDRGLTTPDVIRKALQHQL